MLRTRYLRDKKLVAPIVVAAVIVICGLLVENSHSWTLVLILSMLFGVVAQTWCLVAGYAGQFSIAQMGFFGIGSYVAGILDIHFGVPLLVGVAIGFVGGAVSGLLLGALTTRLRGHYFALISFLLVIALGQIDLAFPGLTGGGYGLSVPIGSGNNVLKLQFSSTWDYYWLAGILVVLVTLILSFLINSRWGLALKAIRESESAADAVGVGVNLLKIFVVGLGAGIAGAAGVIYLSAYKLIDGGTAFGVTSALAPIVGGMLGGVNTILGGLLGQGIVQSISSEASQYFPTVPFNFSELVYAGAILIIVLIAKDGIIGRATWLVNQLGKGKHRFTLRKVSSTNVHGRDGMESVSAIAEKEA